MITLEEIKEAFGHYLTEGRCKTVHKLLTGKLDPLYFKSARGLKRQCFHEPDHQYLIETAVNEAIEGYGTEGIRIPGYHVDNYHYDCVAGYVNTGDTYSATVVWDYRNNNEPVVTTWGDWLEYFEQDEGLENCPNCGQYHDKADDCGCGYTD